MPDQKMEAIKSTKNGDYLNKYILKKKKLCLSSVNPKFNHFKTTSLTPY
jgi:hypothetical protein